MQNKPLISIITVVYNGEKYLEETIKSVINQTYTNIEYIIIDGDSTDGTVDIIKKYEDKIDYWISEKDDGIYDAMNKGIDVVSGNFINFMNAGDKFYNNNILKSVFENDSYKDIDFIYGNLEINHIDFKKIKKTLSLTNLWKGMQFSHQSVFINSDFHRLNKYNLKYKIASDFNLFYNAYTDSYKFFYIDKIISTTLVGGLSDTSHLEVLKENFKIAYNNKFKFYIYYGFMYINIKLKTVIKFILGKRATNYMKRI
jgi:glycosyltransferase involved in cell wall biosynthesis